MKKLFYIITLLLFALPAWADIDTWNGVGISTLSKINGVDVSTLSKINGQDIASASCSTPVNGDEFNEGFGSPLDETWTTVSGTPSYNENLPGTGPTGAYNTCDIGALFETSGAAEESIYWDYGASWSSSNTIVFTVIFYVDSTSSFSAYVTQNLLYWGSAANGVNASSSTAFLVLRRGTSTAGPPTQIRAVGADYGSFFSISPDTYYKAVLTVHGTATSSNLDLDSWNGSAWVDVGTDDFERNATDGRYLAIGAKSGAGDSLKIYAGYASGNSP